MITPQEILDANDTVDAQAEDAAWDAVGWARRAGDPLVFAAAIHSARRIYQQRMDRRALAYRHGLLVSPRQSLQSSDRQRDAL